MHGISAVNKNTRTASSRGDVVELRTSESILRLLPTGNPEVISSSVGLVPRNALVLSGLANFQVERRRVPPACMRVGKHSVASRMLGLTAIDLINHGESTFVRLR
jgi:hypothetical protein